MERSLHTPLNDESAPVAEDIEHGGLSSESRRADVRASVESALEASVERWGRRWLCAVILVVLGMFGVLTWSQWVYDEHRDDPCDEPLAVMLRVLYIIIAIHAFQREIVRHMLCYSVARDGPDAPCRVKFFYRLSLSVALAWPLVGSWMLMHSRECSPELKMAVRVITAYYAVVALVVVIVPGCFIVAMLVLMRRGLVRNRNAAPADLIEQLPKVAFDQSLFSGSGAPGTFPTQCSICLDNFDESREITRTPCPSGGHAFHTECLADWLQRARTCPLCRVDLVDPDATEDAEVGTQLTGSGTEP